MGTTPTRGEKETGEEGVTQNSKALGPCGGAVPLMTALSMGLSLGLLMEILMLVVTPTGVGRNLTALWERVSGDRMPRPSHATLYILHVHACTSMYHKTCSTINS